MTASPHPEHPVPPSRRTDRREPDDRTTQAHVDALLDEALAATFPASDPIAVLAPAA